MPFASPRCRAARYAPGSRAWPGIRVAPGCRPVGGASGSGRLTHPVRHRLRSRRGPGRRGGAASPVDAEGVVSRAAADAEGHLSDALALDAPAAGRRRREPPKRIAQDLAAAAGGRESSGCATTSCASTDELQFLAGMQRIRYVFVYPPAARHRAGRLRGRLGGRRARQCRGPHHRAARSPPGRPGRRAAFRRTGR